MHGRDRFGDFTPYLVTALGLFLICAIAWSLAYSKGYQSSNNDHEAYYARYSGSEKERERCLNLSSVRDIRECFASSEGAYREEDRAEQDLNAQREMADWAEGMLWATYFSIAITAVGIGFVWRTLQANREAVEQASIANSITKEQSRAWVSIDLTPCNDITFPKGDEVEIVFEINVTNMGRSAAKNILVAYDVIDSIGQFGNRDAFEVYARLRVSTARGQERSGRTLPAGVTYVEHGSFPCKIYSRKKFWPVVFISVTYGINGSDEIHQSAFMFNFLVRDEHGAPQTVEDASYGNFISKHDIVYKPGLGGIST